MTTDLDGLSPAYHFVYEFHRVFGLPMNAEPEPSLRETRADLIDEEAHEAQTELISYSSFFDTDAPVSERWRIDPVGQRERLAKELADLVYVAYGTAIALGIDLDEAIRRVHRSNMSKLDDEGNPEFEPNGKVKKGPNYQPPDMTGVAV